MGDPVAKGLVDSLARPGGNTTGITADAGMEIWDKRIGLLRELIPAASRVGYLVSRGAAEMTSDGVAMREAAHQAGISLVGPALEGTIQEAERADALVVGDQLELDTDNRLIIELVEKSRLPAILPYRFWAERGGLIAYGIDGADQYRRAEGYIAGVLQGAKQIANRSGNEI
jgi:putative ABC transport system substrate-binding protein